MHVQTSDCDPGANCNCREYDCCHRNSWAFIQALDLLVDSFAAEMKEKLHAKAMEGFHGWDSPDDFPTQGLVDALKEHAAEESLDPVDVANFCAMIWNRQEPPVKAMHNRHLKGGVAEAHGMQPCRSVQNDDDICEACRMPMGPDNPSCAHCDVRNVEGE